MGGSWYGADGCNLDLGVRGLGLRVTSCPRGPAVKKDRALRSEGPLRGFTALRCCTRLRLLAATFGWLLRCLFLRLLGVTRGLGRSFAVRRRRGCRDRPGQYLRWCRLGGWRPRAIGRR